MSHICIKAPLAFGWWLLFVPTNNAWLFFTSVVMMFSAYTVLWTPPRLVRR